MTPHEMREVAGEIDSVGMETNEHLRDLVSAMLRAGADALEEVGRLTERVTALEAENGKWNSGYEALAASIAVAYGASVNPHDVPAIVSTLLADRRRAEADRDRYKAMWTALKAWHDTYEPPSAEHHDNARGIREAHKDSREKMSDLEAQL